MVKMEFHFFVLFLKWVHRKIFAKTIFEFFLQCAFVMVQSIIYIFNSVFSVMIYLEDFKFFILDLTSKNYKMKSKNEILIPFIKKSRDTSQSLYLFFECTDLD
jgi:hypothetical protein